MDCSAASLAACIRICKISQTSSTRLELQTLLRALEHVPAQAKVTVYTDSQNIIDLPQRRLRLEAQSFCSKVGKPLNNGDLYRRFYDAWDRLRPVLVKVKGHSPAVQKSRLEQVFALVDKAARNCSRKLRPTE